MKRSNLTRYLLIDPLALAVACVISLLFANTTQQYLNTAKRNFGTKGQTVVCLQISDDTSPEDRPDAWEIEKTIFQKDKKKCSQLPVTFSIHQDYGNKLSGYFYGLYQPLVWLPSIPIAHRKLII